MFSMYSNICQIVTTVLIIIFSKLEEDEDGYETLIAVFIIILNIFVILISLYLILFDYKLYFRSIILKCLKNGNEYKRRILK